MWMFRTTMASISFDLKFKFEDLENNGITSDSQTASGLAWKLICRQFGDEMEIVVDCENNRAVLMWAQVSQRTLVKVDDVIQLYQVTLSSSSRP
ncbi:hypothetical protein L596_023069 [Steinernema carpocapsae]|uniref:Uncharacterized protein n=1 Tax=Steinernema carpocapsae TaxID=34508 RepID=A0A4U5MDC6_STECR|nr:hypothetical protein L596_023069 [Steinernema carpocapsae]